MDIPDDCLPLVFHFLDEQSLSSVMRSYKWRRTMCKDMKHIPGVYDKRIDVKDVEQWKKLFPKLTHCYIKGFEPLIYDLLPLYKDLKLDLSDCEDVIDVSMFRNVHELNLCGCTGITDVSALGNVHTLYLWGCTGIKDPSMFARINNFYR